MTHNRNHKAKFDQKNGLLVKALKQKYRAQLLEGEAKDEIHDYKKDDEVFLTFEERAAKKKTAHDIFGTVLD